MLVDRPVAAFTGECAQGSGDCLPCLLGVDHRVNLPGFHRKIRVDGRSLIVGHVLRTQRFHVLPALLGFLQILAMNDVDRALGAEHRDLAGRPGVVEVRAEIGRAHV